MGGVRGKGGQGDPVLVAWAPWGWPAPVSTASALLRAAGLRAVRCRSSRGAARGTAARPNACPHWRLRDYPLSPRPGRTPAPSHPYGRLLRTALLQTVNGVVIFWQEEHELFFGGSNKVRQSRVKKKKMPLMPDSATTNAGISTGSLPGRTRVCVFTQAGFLAGREARLLQIWASPAP